MNVPALALAATFRPLFCTRAPGYRNIVNLGHFLIPINSRWNVFPFPAPVFFRFRPIQWISVHPKIRSPM